MKVEPRGKYEGVKVHLDKEECDLLIKFFKLQHMLPAVGEPELKFHMNSMELTFKLGKKIAQLLTEKPTLLSPRTPEEIKAELIEEFHSAKEKLQALDDGQDWKKVKVQVTKA